MVQRHDGLRLDQCIAISAASLYHLKAFVDQFLHATILSVYRPLSGNFPGVTSELEIWRAANLLLRRHGDKAKAEGAARAAALSAAGDHEGAAVWLRITHAIVQLANKTPPGPVH
jgi:hypothetical protein